MMVRHHQIEFNSGALVFPGGSVDTNDCEIAGQPELYAGEQGVDAEALGFRIAAIRETFEESGILLARRKGSGALIEAAHAREIEAASRADLCAGKTSFLDVVNGNGLVLALDALVPYAHWITPEGMPKRFDTWFFLAAAPPDQARRPRRPGIDRFDLAVAARGAGRRGQRPFQAAVSDHAQPDPAGQAADYRGSAGRCAGDGHRHRDAGHDQDGGWWPAAADPPRGRL